MKQTIEFIELFKSAMAIMGPITAGVWFMIKSYYSKEKDLLLQKQSLTDEAIKKLTALIEKVSTSFNEHRITVKDLEASLKVLNSELQNIKESLKQATNQISEYSKTTQKKIEKIESEIVQLTKETFMVKKAK